MSTWLGKFLYLGARIGVVIIPLIGTIGCGTQVSISSKSPPASTVEFGINGHPLSAGAYTAMSLEQQIALLKSLGLKSYRINIDPRDAAAFSRLDQLLTESGDIRILPVVDMDPEQYSSEEAAYQDAKAAVSKLAAQFGDRIHVWELGNELDLYPDRYPIVRGLIRGMTDGLKSASPGAQSIVQTTQRGSAAIDPGFLQRLAQDGIAFDIVGYHFYTPDGHLPAGSLQVLHDTFHKPIWITEFDQASISPQLGPATDPHDQAQALTTALHEIAADASQYDVESALIYELLDQPEVVSMPSVNPCEGQFGILAANGGSTDASRAVKTFLGGAQ